MANGFHGSPERWQRICEPLTSLDSRLELFGSHNGLVLQKNMKNWPGREFRWSDDLERLIQIFLQNEKQLTWTLWICAYEDREGQRYWRTQTLQKAVSIEQLQASLEIDLEDGWRQVMSWKPEDLCPAR